MKTRILSTLIFVTTVSSPAWAEWSVDFSRRQDQMSAQDKQISAAAQVQAAQDLESPSRSLASTPAEETGTFDRVFNSNLPTQEIVIINTEQGFLPSTVRVKEGAQYKLVVVNVNEKVRNVSFVLDAFSEHHATFFGKIKSFYINPKKEGVYTFMSPETSAQGRLVVQPTSSSPAAPNNLQPNLVDPAVDVRAPASE